MKLEKNKAKEIVISTISKILNNEVRVTEDMQLIGSGTSLDSMKLVEMCIALEDRAEELGFEFDWTSDTTMSKSLSMFRTVLTLSNEFARQSGT